jgi:signal transduction histidine kinase
MGFLRSLRLGFAARLGLATSALIVVVCVTQSWILARRDLDYVRRYLTDRGRSAGEQLAIDAETAMLTGRVGVLRQLADQARIRNGITYARFFDRQGLLLVSTGPIASGDDTWEFRAPVVIHDPAKPRSRLPFVPAAGGEVAGTVAVGISLEPLEALRRRTVTTATLVTTLFTLIAVLGAVLLARAITRPLKAIAAAAHALARGDLAVRADASSDDEIGRLAASFNAMVDGVRQSHTALEQKVAELEEANRLKAEFVATVSHELRTPLNVIIGYADMLAEGTELSDEQATMIGAIRRYSTLQRDLITNVLDFSRLSSGRVSFHVERFPLAPLLQEVQALHAGRARTPAVRLTVAAETAIGTIETDRVKLLEVLHNLVDNALKFTEAGTVAVVARAGPGPDRVTIEVRDSGAGIPAGELGTIFEPFRQVGASSTRETGGVGLGLSIVKQLVDALGGKVSVASRLGEGSTFRVELPCRLPGAPERTDEPLPAAVVALDEVNRNAAAFPTRAHPLGTRARTGPRAVKS